LCPLASFSRRRLRGQGVIWRTTQPGALPRELRSIAEHLASQSAVGRWPMRQRRKEPRRGATRLRLCAGAYWGDREIAKIAGRKGWGSRLKNEIPSAFYEFSRLCKAENFPPRLAAAVDWRSRTSRPTIPRERSRRIEQARIVGGRGPRVAPCSSAQHVSRPEPRARAKSRFPPHFASFQGFARRKISHAAAIPIPSSGPEADTPLGVSLATLCRVVVSTRARADARLVVAI
jgi:hypothetical protein